MYRLYIDETGNPDLKASSDPNHRYLSLTGVAIKLDHVKNIVNPLMDELKNKVFSPDPDMPLVLHRKDIVQRNRPFHVLRDPEKAELFDSMLLNLLTEANYAVITAVIDKREHLNRYSSWHHEPYHYCLEVLIERYVLWLRDRNAIGDVMAEVRGRKFDRKLEDSFSRLFRKGNNNINSQEIQKRLSSSKLKLKTKEKNVSGLQLADLLAHPSALYMRSLQEGDVTPKGFGADIVQILVEQKYRRKRDGQIPGYGTKWLP